MNWKAEAIERLSKYAAMNQAVENLPKEITRLEWAVQQLRGVNPEKLSAKSMKGPGDDMLINNIVHRQELIQAYENAKIWVDTTSDAFSVLSDEERMILENMYVMPRQGVLDFLSGKLGVEKTSIYRKRDQALCRFTMALYGIS